ncbi:MAG: type II toxin-antitoxin system RelB/DinJ family antitoxin [Oscillospiraceae bacterium]|nr:type II toxin-antitoxin system RelB/DinJ family antitoxin [Oscillospiraceae bacterium]
MPQTSLIQVKVDEEFKVEVDNLFSDLGFDTSTAIRIFLRQALKWRGLPFEVSQIPNAETIEAIEEGERLLKDPNAKRYTNFSEILEEVKNEISNT